MRPSRTILFGLAVLLLAAACVTPLLAEDPRHPGIFKDYAASPSASLRFFASEAGRDALLHSPNPTAIELLRHFHPDAVGQYPLQPLMQPAPMGVARPAVSVTGCGTDSGTVMNRESGTSAVAQRQPSVDFLLSELGSGKDLVVEHGDDSRYVTGVLDSYNAIYVHRDGSVPCYGGTDFEMGNPPIADPFNNGNFLTGTGEARVIADPAASRKQFIFADMRFNGTTSGIGLRRISAAHFESTGTCPAGTLTFGQEATCAGTTAILVNASLDNEADAPSIAQDPRSSGTGAGDIYIVATSFRYLRSVITLTACKATFTTAADCSDPIVVSGSQNDAQFGSVAVVGGGSNAGKIVLSYVDNGAIEFVSCTPAGAPSHPSCGSRSTVRNDGLVYSYLTDNGYSTVDVWPAIAARTDSSGQTIFVVWSECKVAYAPGLVGCPDADIVMSVDTSLSSPSWAFHHVSTSSGHQIMPSIAYDSGQNVINIGYYSTKSDLYKNKYVMLMNQIAGGGITVGSTINLTTSYDSIGGDGSAYGFGTPPFGSFLGMAARGGTGSGSSRVYVGFTNNARLGTYGTITNTQSDNNIVRATY